MPDPITLLIIALLTAAIGVSLGASGLGGFLIPALLVAVLGMDPVTAVVHGLISFLIPGVIVTVSYWRRENRPSWWIAILLCVGTIPGLLAGRWVMTIASPRVLQIVLAAIVLAAGITLLVRLRAKNRTPREPRPRVVAPAAIGAGLVGGLSTVLAGVGGPLVTVPALSALGMEITPVVGAALFNSVFGVAFGAVSLVGTVQLQPVVLLVITLAQLIGVLVGARLHDRIADRWLVPVVAAASVLTGGWLLIKAIG